MPCTAHPIFALAFRGSFVLEGPTMHKKREKREQERRDSALAELQNALKRGDMKRVHAVVLLCLQVDCSDAEIGRVVRLATLAGSMPRIMTRMGVA